MAPRIFIFSIVLGAENLFSVKSIETHARTFLTLNILSVGTVGSPKWPRFYNKKSAGIRFRVSTFKARKEIGTDQSERNFLGRTTFIHFHFRESFFLFFQLSFDSLHT